MAKAHHAENLSPAQSRAAQSLATLRDRLEFVRADDGPISMAAAELREKEHNLPQKLDRSSKLFRAIDDIEIAREALSMVADELRRMSGWASEVSHG